LVGRVVVLWYRHLLLSVILTMAVVISPVVATSTLVATSSSLVISIVVIGIVATSLVIIVVPILPVVLPDVIRLLGSRHLRRLERGSRCGSEGGS
jgi:hypothetical protein